MKKETKTNNTPATDGFRPEVITRGSLQDAIDPNTGDFSSAIRKTICLSWDMFYVEPMITTVREVLEDSVRPLVVIPEIPLTDNPLNVDEDDYSVEGMIKSAVVAPIQAAYGVGERRAPTDEENGWIEKVRKAYPKNGIISLLKFGESELAACRLLGLPSSHIVILDMKTNPNPGVSETTEAGRESPSPNGDDSQSI